MLSSKPYQTKHSYSDTQIGHYLHLTVALSFTNFTDVFNFIIHNSAWGGFYDAALFSSSCSTTFLRSMNLSLFINKCTTSVAHRVLQPCFKKTVILRLRAKLTQKKSITQSQGCLSGRRDQFIRNLHTFNIIFGNMNIFSKCSCYFFLVCCFMRRRLVFQISLADIKKRFGCLRTATFSK